jgi:hypothetical protein
MVSRLSGNLFLLVSRIGRGNTSAAAAPDWLKP